MNISAIDLNLLVAFDALFSERNVTRAARRVGLSQPAMSNALSRLRALLDDELFVRSGRGMEPTARAQSLALPVREALARIEEALAPALTFDPARLDRVVRIAMTDNSMAVLLIEMIERVRETAPNLDLHIKNTRPSGMPPMLDDGEIDLAVGVASDLEPRHRAAPLYSDRLVGIARRGRFGPDGPTLEQFVEAEHALVAPRNGPGGAIDAALAAQGLKRRVFLTLPQFIFAPYAVAKADLVSCLPARIALAKADLLDLEIFEPPIEMPEFTVSLIWHGRDDADPAHQWLRATISAVAQEVTQAGEAAVRAMCGPTNATSGAKTTEFCS
ncbi:LysR family transcriptional regulator [Stappia stellulata]|uniref:LysR family transcriptional regulator n=1 Tax=Stappia stellulata TaxID=71235 RepID=UPI000404106F|nr:LysR family transcriptional regulator [Stappia stellulata]